MTEKRLLVTGSRKWWNVLIIKRALRQARIELGTDDIVLVSGACPSGADRICERVWESWGLPVERHPAQWSMYGKSAGPIRNQEMVDLGADLCTAFPMADSSGTRDCMRRARFAGIRVIDWGPK